MLHRLDTAVARWPWGAVLPAWWGQPAAAELCLQGRPDPGSPQQEHQLGLPAGSGLWARSPAPPALHLGTRGCGGQRLRGFLSCHKALLRSISGVRSPRGPEPSALCGPRRARPVSGFCPGAVVSALCPACLESLGLPQQGTAGEPGGCGCRWVSLWCFRAQSVPASGGKASRTCARWGRREGPRSPRVPAVEAPCGAGWVRAVGLLALSLCASPFWGHGRP